MARSDFWVTVQFNFEQLELHYYKSNRKSNVSGGLEKDESFKWSTFHQDLSYHSNEMTPCPILHKTEQLATRDNFGNKTSGSGTWHSCLNDSKIVTKSIRAFSRKLRVNFQGVKIQQKESCFKCYHRLCPQDLTKWHSSLKWIS